MNQLSAARLSRLWTILIPMTIFAGCGDGDGPTRIVNEPAAPYDGPPAACFESLSFEDVCDFSYSFAEFEGGPGTIVTIAGEPLIAGDAGNTSEKTIKAIKARASSGNVFGGFVVTVLSTPPAPFDIPAGGSITVKVWSQRPVPLLLEPHRPLLDGSNEYQGQGVEAQHGGSGWEELTFDLPAGPYDATGFVFIFDNGRNGDFAADPDNWTFYIDDITPVEDAGGGPPPGGTAPTTSAPTPTQAEADVISLYSDAYTDIASVWPTDWSSPNNTTSDVTIDGGLVKEHLSINFVGVEFQVDASAMTHIHLDVWTPDASSLLVRLVDFGGDGFGGGNDTQGELTFDSGSTPALTQGTWVSLDIALSDLQAAGLASLADLNQIVLDPTADGSTVYVDNVYFYNDAGGGGTAPTTSAPTPTQDAADVISLYSDAYTDVATTWPTPWSDPNNTTSDVTIDGGLVKEHLSINFVGVEFQVDASAMTHIHFDVWTPDADSLLVRLVDFGGDGFGGGNDTQGELTFDSGSTPALGQGSWVSLDIQLSDLQAAGLASLADLNQIVLDPTADGSTVYVDNVYFYNDTGGGGGTAPTTSAPTPTQDPANVISLYSDAYTDLAVTWPTPWSVPNDTTSDVTIDGGLVKEHLNLSFVGVEFASLDASGMTHFHLDVWTPDADSLLVRLVDFGGDGFGGGNDTQGELTFNSGSTPALTQGSWVSLDIALSDLQAAGLASLTDLNQIVLDAGPDGTILYVDNVYFYSDTPATAPTTSAPTPTQDPANVISLYSDAYTDLAVTWPTPWSVPNDTTSDVTIDGGLVKEHFNLSFVGVEFASLDASGMTHFHLDVWTPDADSLLVRLVDFGGDGFGGGNDTQGELTFNSGSTPALTQGSWVSLDIALSDLQAAGLASLTDLNQIVLDAGPDGTILYVDNVYFYSDTPATAPTTSAPTPTQDPANVISLYSDAYTDLAVTWPTPWSVPNDTTSDVTIDGGLVKEHLNLSFVGVEFASLDASGMTHFHLDVWTPDADSLLVRLVDFGGDGFGGGNDTQGELTFNSGSTPALTQGSWVSLDIALSDLQAAGLASLTDLNQIVLDAGPDGTILYVDNVYFYNDAGGGGGELAVNGGFETGDLSDWTLFPSGSDPNEQTVVTTNPKSGTYAGRLNNTVRPSASIIKQANRTPAAIGQTATITFSARGILADGGVAFAEFFTELSGGGASSSVILGGGPLALNADPNVWTNFSFDVNITTDVSGGVTLQLTATTGGAGTSTADVYYDDISIVVQ